MVEYAAEDWRRMVIDAINEHGGPHKTISREAGLGPTFVRDFIERNQEPGVEKLRKLCNYLGLDFVKLFGKGPKTFEDIASDVQKTALARAFKDALAQPVHIQKMIIEGMRGQLKFAQVGKINNVRTPSQKITRASEKKTG